MSTFPERLLELKIENKVFQKDIAQAAGISLRTYQRYESGERKPDSEVLNKLAVFFHVSVDYLLGLSNNRTKDSNLSEKELNDFSSRLIKLRREHDYTKSEAACFCNLSEQTYNRLETNGSPSLESVLRIAEAYEVSIDYLLGRSDDPNIY